MGLNLGKKECPKCGYKEDSDKMGQPYAYCPECDGPLDESYLRAGVVFARKGIKKITDQKSMTDRMVERLDWIHRRGVYKERS